MSRWAIWLLFGLITVACDQQLLSDQNRKQRGNSDPPNVLIIVTDDQRADGTLSVMPEVERWFGEQGTRFSQAFTTTPFCCPARVSIFTGLYTHNHLVISDWDNFDGDTKSLQFSTMQRVLRENGYVTGMFGKYLNAWPIEEDPPHFDRWAIVEEEKYHGGSWNVQGNVDEVEDYSTHFIGDQAQAFLEDSEREDAQPWMMVLAPQAPHEPLTPEPRYRTARVPPFEPGPSFLKANPKGLPPILRRERTTRVASESSRVGQLRTLMSVDDMVGDVVRTIERFDEDQSTLAFYLSDNGYLWGEHQLQRKLLPYTDSVKIPMFMRWPGHVEAGNIDDRLVGNIDLAPTVLDAVGMADELVMDGRSMLGSGGRDRIVLEYFPNPQWASIRTHDYQFTLWFKDLEVVFSEYYDLERDPHQLRNLLTDKSSANDPDFRSLFEQLGSDIDCRGAACP